MAIKLPDGTRLQLADWTHQAYWSCFTHLLLEADPVMIQPGYTLGPDNDRVPAPITLSQFARRTGMSEWRLRCSVTEYLNLERKGRSADRVYRRLTSFMFHAEVDAAEQNVDQLHRAIDLSFGVLSEVASRRVDAARS